MERANLNPFGLSAPQYDPVAFGKMKADTINSTSGDLTGCDCPKCLNRGNIAVPKEDGGVSIRECDCMKIRRCVWEMERSGLKNIIREKTFDTYTVAEEWQKAIKAGAMAYADNPGGWLLFCGQPGSGKTHLCTAVCRHRLLAGDEVRYKYSRYHYTKGELTMNLNLVKIAESELNGEARCILALCKKPFFFLWYKGNVLMNQAMQDGQKITGALETMWRYDFMENDDIMSEVDAATEIIKQEAGSTAAMQAWEAWRIDADRSRKARAYTLPAPMVKAICKAVGLAYNPTQVFNLYAYWR